MFLKINKRRITIYCLMGSSGQLIQTGTIYNFSLAENIRSGVKVNQKVIAALGSYTLNEYEPLKYTYGSNCFGMSTRMPKVNSYDVNDETSFRKVEPDKTIKFYHTLTKKLSAAAAIYEIPQDDIRKYCSQVMQCIPLYTQDDYKLYIREEVKNKLKHEVTVGPGNVDKLINGTAAYEICDYVICYQDGLLVGYRNMLSLHVDYDFKLM